MSFFKKPSTFGIIAILLLLPGLIVSLSRSTLRIIGEQKNQTIEIAADFNEFKELALEDNLHVRDLLNRLKGNGASSVVLSEDTLASLEKENKITIKTSQDILKLSLDENFKIEHPVAQNALATLWVHSEDKALLSRIEHNLSLKLPSDRLIRIHKNLLLINKSTQGFKERVGLGFSNETIEMANEASLGVILRITNYPGLTKENAEKYLNLLPPPASTSAIMFAREEAFGYRGDLKEIVKLLTNRSYRLCNFEFTQPKGMVNYLNILKPKRLVIQGHSISRKELDLKYQRETAIARWVRAAKERSIRLLFLRCFHQSESHFIDNLVEYNLDYLSQTVTTLKKLNFKIAQDHRERINEPRLIIGQPIKSEVFATGLALAMGIIILLKITIFKNFSNGLLIILFFLGAGVFLGINENLWIISTGLLGAIAYTAIGPVWAINSLEEKKIKEEKENTESNNSTLKIAFSLVFKSLAPSILGGILLVGLHSNVDFMLKYSQFRGIKLAFIIPLLITGLWALKLYGTEIFKLLHKPISLFSLSLMGIGTLALVAYILRSGNLTIIKPSLLEEKFRILLENVLVARPRYKEFLIGYPASFLFAFFYMRRSFYILPAVLIFVQMGQVSVLNSMCHFHTPLLLTALRIFNGLWLGLAFGVLALVSAIVLRLLFKLTAHKKQNMFLIGYFGYGNAGDELLWQTFAERLSQDYPQYEISVLYSDAKTNKASKFKLVKRSKLTELIDELITTEFIVVPGGGVFQSKTSLESMAYYLLLITLARLTGAKIVLPAQGLGPWNTQDFGGQLLVKWLGYQLKHAAYLSLRDEKSKEEHLKITGDSEGNLTTDLVFLNKAIKKASQRNIHKLIRVYVILRSSIEGSLEIAQNLLKITATDDSIELIPISMQPEEDEQVWIDAGWGKEIEYIFDKGSPFDGADMVISMRLHGCILSTVTCKPWLGLAYDPKVMAYAQSIDWKLCKEVHEVDEDYLKVIINELKKTRAHFSERLHNSAIESTKIAEADYQKMISQIF